MARGWESIDVNFPDGPTVKLDEGDTFETFANAFAAAVRTERQREQDSAVRRDTINNIINNLEATTSQKYINHITVARHLEDYLILLPTAVKVDPRKAEVINLLVDAGYLTPNTICSNSESTADIPKIDELKSHISHIALKLRTGKEIPHEDYEPLSALRKECASQSRMSGADSLTLR